MILLQTSGTSSLASFSNIGAREVVGWTFSAPTSSFGKTNFLSFLLLRG